MHGVNLHKGENYECQLTIILALMPSEMQNRPALLVRRISTCHLALFSFRDAEDTTFVFSSLLEGIPCKGEKLFNEKGSNVSESRGSKYKNFYIFSNQIDIFPSSILKKNSETLALFICFILHSFIFQNEFTHF